MYYFMYYFMYFLCISLCIYVLFYVFILITCECQPVCWESSRYIVFVSVIYFVTMVLCLECKAFSMSTFFFCYYGSVLHV